ncbi:MAG: hypothetical protein IPM63_18275 [Acidobacteriota bacterium]|nr:MAG: hypothetical protein IPM63_18275 [Acidobacteriota bacterium]
MKLNRVIFAAVLLAGAAQFVFSQAPAGYSYKAQRAFIPADLGEVYIGMPFRDFVKKIDIRDAEADTRFDYIHLNIAYEKGPIDGLTVRVHGFTREQIKAMSKEVEVTVKGDLGDYTVKEERIDPSKIEGDGFVYAFYIGFKPDFDLKSWVIKTYGNDGEVRKPDGEYHFFDIQWTKKTDDGLDWLIRSFHEGDGRSLQLLGRISGTEWAVD